MLNYLFDKQMNIAKLVCGLEFVFFPFLFFIEPLSAEPSASSRGQNSYIHSLARFSKDTGSSLEDAHLEETVLSILHSWTYFFLLPSKILGTTCICSSHSIIRYSQNPPVLSNADAISFTCWYFLGFQPSVFQY